MAQCARHFLIVRLADPFVLMQGATFNYDILYKVAKATSDEVRAKVSS